jgi:RNA polymerase sigma-70 factor (ECF subfamily)
MNRREYLKLRNYYGREQLGVDKSNPVESPVEGMRPGLLAFPEVCCLVREGLETLDDSQRSALHMAYFEDMPLKDIAKKTGETLANVRHHYYRGLSRLRSLFENPNGNGVRNESGKVRKDIARREGDDAKT